MFESGCLRACARVRACLLHVCVQAFVLTQHTDKSLGYSNSTKCNSRSVHDSGNGKFFTAALEHNLYENKINTQYMGTAATPLLRPAHGKYTTPFRLLK